MANPFLAVRIPPDLEAAIAERIQATGQSKSDLIIEALRLYLEIKPCATRLAAIEERLARIEAIAFQGPSLKP